MPTEWDPAPIHNQGLITSPNPLYPIRKQNPNPKKLTAIKLFPQTFPKSPQRILHKRPKINTNTHIDRSESERRRRRKACYKFV